MVIVYRVRVRVRVRARIAAGPIKATIHSETRDGKWAGQWDIYPHYARFTLLRAGHPYWFLYESTPGGKLDLDRDYWVRSNGARLPLTESWFGHLPSPQWVYFGDAALRRVLFLVQHEDDDASDQFWQMQGNITVFGFGLQYRCCEKYVTLILDPGRVHHGVRPDSEVRPSRQGD